MSYIGKKCPTCHEDGQCGGCSSDICEGGNNIRECNDCESRFNRNMENAAIQQNAPILKKLDEISKRLDDIEERLNNETL